MRVLNGVVTPGVRGNDVDYDAVLDGQPPEGHEAQNPEDFDQDEQLVASLTVPKPKQRRALNLKVSFVITPEVHATQAYSTIYPAHPSKIAATRRGTWKLLPSGSDPYTGQSTDNMQQRYNDVYPKERFDHIARHRAQILNSTLVHGANCERALTLEPDTRHVLSVIACPHARAKFLRRLAFDSSEDIPVFFCHADAVSTKEIQEKTGDQAGPVARG